MDQIQTLMNLPYINNFEITEIDDKFNSLKLLWNNVKNYQTHS